MIPIRPTRLALFAAAALAAGLALPARADDPPAAEGRAAEVETPVTPDLPRPDAVLDAMPLVIYPADPRAALRAADGDGSAADEPEPIAIEATGAFDLEAPPLGERPTPREALRADELGETIMRPRGGSATGGKPDVPPER
ncbi:hypothetical protein [Salinarimonas sp.]|uniref:hypothetical protein n=1 Tax=Salinarimonas sp. TaxID=2766526 RepID=UPI0032D98AB6